MNFLAFVAAVMIMTADSNDSGRSSDTRVSAAIEYRTVDRSGNELIVSVRSGDPYYGRYYGRDDFYYNDCHYYRYVPRRRVVVREPVYYVREPVYVVRERYYDDDWRYDRDKKYAKDYYKSRKDDDKDWNRSNGKGMSASHHDNGKGNGKSKGKKH